MKGNVQDKYHSNLDKEFYLHVGGESHVQEQGS